MIEGEVSLFCAAKSQRPEGKQASLPLSPRRRQDQATTTIDQRKWVDSRQAERERSFSSEFSPWVDTQVLNKRHKALMRAMTELRAELAPATANLGQELSQAIADAMANQTPELRRAIADAMVNQTPELCRVIADAIADAIAKQTQELVQAIANQTEELGRGIADAIAKQTQELTRAIIDAMANQTQDLMAEGGVLQQSLQAVRDQEGVQHEILQAVDNLVANSRTPGMRAERRCDRILPDLSRASGAQAIGFVVWAAFVASQIVGLLNTDEEWPEVVGKAGMSVAIALRLAFDFSFHTLWQGQVTTHDPEYHEHEE